MEPTAPLTQTPSPTPVPTAAPALLQANVDYLPGITIFGASSALLEWSADNRIKLFKMNFDTNTATEVLFDVPLAQIEAVSGSMIMLTFKIAGKKYNAQFSSSAMPKMAVGGAVGLGLAAHDTNASGINLWINKLKENGVNVAGFKGWGWSMKWGLIVAGVIIVVIVIVAVASTSFH